MPAASGDSRSATMSDSATAGNSIAAAPLPPGASSGYPGNSTAVPPPHRLLLPPALGVPVSLLAKDKATGAQGSPRRGRADLSFLDASSLSGSAQRVSSLHWKSRRRLQLGFAPKPNPASHARLLAVKCTEVAFPAGICFLTKLEDLGAHKTCAVPSSAGPCGLSCSGAAIPFPKHFEFQPLARGREKEECFSGRRISPRRGFSRGRQGDPSLHPQRCRHPPAAAPHLPPEPGARSSHTHTHQSSFPAVQGSNKTSPRLSQVQLLSLTCSLASFLTVSQKSLPRAVPSPEQRRGRPCSQGWSSGASGLFLFCTAQGQLRTHHPKSLSQELEKHPTEIPSSPRTPTDNKIDLFPRKFCWQGHLQLHTAGSTAGWGGGEQSRAGMLH